MFCYLMSSWFPRNFRNSQRLRLLSPPIPIRWNKKRVKNVPNFAIKGQNLRRSKIASATAKGSYTIQLSYKNSIPWDNQDTYTILRLRRRCSRMASISHLWLRMSSKHWIWMMILLRRQIIWLMMEWQQCQHQVWFSNRFLTIKSWATRRLIC